MCFKLSTNYNLLLKLYPFAFLPEKFLGRLLFVAYHFSIVPMQINDNPEKRKIGETKKTHILLSKSFIFNFESIIILIIHLFAKCKINVSKLVCRGYSSAPQCT